MPGVATPPIIVEGFGVNAGASYINTIPVSSQIGTNPGYASYNDGFVPLNATPIASGGIPPRIEDMNGVLFAATQNIAAWIGGQYWPFSSTFATQNGGYALNAIVAMSNGTGFWLNTVSGNSNNPDTTAAASSGWVPLVGYGEAQITGLTNANVTLTSVQAAASIIVFSGTLTGNVQIIFPTWTRRWTVFNGTTGAFTLSCKTASGGGVSIPQGGWSYPVDLIGDGTNIDAVQGLINSGSFTANPSGPWTSPPSGTMNYSVRNGIVSLWSTVQIQATATSSALISLTLPAAITPATYKVVVCSGVFNGGSGWGELRVANSGASTLAASAYASAPPPYSVGAGAFDSGKTAGIDIGFNAVYSLD